VRSDPKAIIPPSRRCDDARSGTAPWTSTSGAPGGHEVTDGAGDDQPAVVPARPRGQAALVEGLDGPGPSAAHHEGRGAVGGRWPLRGVAVGQWRRGRRDHPLGRLHHQRRHRHRPQPVDEAVEEEQEQH
jgi:hypothetical protein